MKKTVLLFILSLLVQSVSFSKQEMVPLKGPVVVEAITNYSSVSEALLAAKKVLLVEQFIVQGEIGANSFTAKRTTAAEADYYVADVSCTMLDGKAKITITFVKVGTGLLKLEKVAEKIKTELEKQ